MNNTSCIPLLAIPYGQSFIIIFVITSIHFNVLFQVQGCYNLYFPNDGIPLLTMAYKHSFINASSLSILELCCRTLFNSKMPGKSAKKLDLNVFEPLWLNQKVFIATSTKA